MRDSDLFTFYVILIFLRADYSFKKIHVLNNKKQFIVAFKYLYYLDDTDKRDNVQYSTSNCIDEFSEDALKAARQKRRLLLLELHYL